MAVPAGGTADLIVVQADLLFGHLKSLLDTPAGAGHPHPRGQVTGPGGPDDIGPPVGGVREGAPEEQGVSPVRRGGGRQEEALPVVPPFPLATRPGAEPLPVRGRQLRIHLGHDPSVPAGLEGLVPGDRQHVGQVLTLPPGPPVPGVAVDRIPHHPGPRPVGSHDPGQHPLGQGRLGGKGRVGGQTDRLQARRVLGPRPRQIECPGPQRVAPGAGVGQEDAYLAVRHLARRPAVRPRHPRGMGTLLQTRGLIDNPDPRRIPQMVLHVGLQCRTGVGRRPDRPPQQVRQAIGRGVPAARGPRPAILALCPTEQTVHVGLGPLPGFHPGQTGPQPGSHFVVLGLPSGDRGPGHGFRGGDREGRHRGRGHRHSENSPTDTRYRIAEKLQL